MDIFLWHYFYYEHNDTQHVDCNYGTNIRDRFRTQRAQHINYEHEHLDGLHFPTWVKTNFWLIQVFVSRKADH